MLLLCELCMVSTLKYAILWQNVKVKNVGRMERLNNKATILKNKLNLIINCVTEDFDNPQNPLIRDILAHTFNVNDAAPGEIYFTYAEFAKLPSEILIDLRELGEKRVPLELVSGDIEKLSNYLSKEFHFGLRFANFKLAITEDISRSLTHAEFYLNNGADFESLDRDSENLSKISELKSTLFKLLDTVETNDELPSKLKIFFTIHIFKLIEAMQDYQRTGDFDSLKYATDAIIAQIIRDTELQSESEGISECTTFSNVLKNILTIVGTGNDFIQAIENMNKFTELPFIQ